MIDLLPYVEVDGKRTVTDEQLIRIFQQMESDDLRKTVFYTGAVQSDRDFINFCKNPENLVVFYALGKDCAGFAWLNNQKDNNAFGHFCMFKSIWGKHTQEAGKKTLDYWFSWEHGGVPVFDVLIGMVPDINHKAIRFVESIGFKQIGVIPKVLKDFYSEKRMGMTVFYKERP